jgi:phage shock protein PspC (stress-responsive transcriptional regulator)
VSTNQTTSTTSIGESAGTPHPRQLRRRLDNRVIAGVCSGLADYFAIDPILVRLAFVVVTFAGGAVVLAYIVLWLVMTPAPSGMVAHSPAAGPSAQGSFWLGAFLIALGILFLIGNTGLFAWWNWSLFWPLALVAIGALILSRRVGDR